MQKITIQGKTATLLPGKNPGAPVLYLNTFSEEEQKVGVELQKARLPDFSLVTISNLHWSHDMVPWDAPPLFRQAEPCTGGADAYLQLLTEEFLPRIEHELPGVPCWRGLVGYSLAGLFAVYALYRTELFSRVASVSGSLWFPGIQEYIFSHEMKGTPDRLYFSVGDKEHKTRHPLLQKVEENTRAIQAYYQNQGICTVFQQNAGNHYQHAAQRTVAAIAWLLES